jgi:hypothetical protein
VTAFTGKSGCRLAEIVENSGAGSVADQEFAEIAAIGCGGRKDCRKPSGLAGVWVGACVEEQPNGFSVSAESQGCVERLIGLRVL